MRNFAQFVIAVLLAVITLPAPLVAQNATGAINGEVADPKGALIPAAAVTALDRNTGAVRKVKTNHDGAFYFDNLAPGEYEISAEHAGFTTQTQLATVRVGATTTAAFALSLGTSTQTVEVSSAAITLNTTDAVMGSFFDKEQIEALPLNGRSFL